MIPRMTAARVLPVCGASLALLLAACAPAPTSPTSSGGATGTGGRATSGTGGSSPSGSGGAVSTNSGGAPVSTGGSSSSGGASASGGSSAGTGGAASGGAASGGTSAGTGGSASGGSGAVGGRGGTTSGSGGAVVTGSGGQGAVTFQRPAGVIPNTAQPAGTTNLPQADWKKGLIGTSKLVGKPLDQPSVVNGYLLVAGMEEFWMYDVADPAAPKLIADFKTPNRCGTCGEKGEGEAESHTISFARYGDKFYMVTTGGTGIDTWDITNAAAPKHLAQVKISGVSYGDYTEAVWGLSWQGQYIYVGTTNNGINVFDANDPAAPVLSTHLATSAYGGVSAGPIDAVGTVLVVTTPKESGGVATLDISDPIKPTKLASFTANKSYIGQFYRHYVFLQSPVRAWDVLTNPANIGSGSSPIGSLNTDSSEYMSFSDDHMFLGHVRPGAGSLPGASKIDVTNPRAMKVVNRIWGRLDSDKNDDQFTIALGNLLVMADDQDPFYGFTIGVHQAAPDTTPPVVDTVIPKNGATGISTTARIGISFSDNIELATVNAASFIVRPMGGQPLAGKWGLRMGVVNFDPDGDLQPATTYEVVLPKGGLTDLVRNPLAADFKSTFTTK